MKAVKAGEYIGNDERTYRWGKNAVGRLWTEVWDESFPRWITASMDPEDWPAAKDALDALIAAEQDAEWVEWPVGGDRFRIRPDGSAPQWDDGEDWAEEREDIDWVIAYRKGREVAQAENEALREQVRALVEAVDAAEQHDKVPTLYYKISTRLWNHVLQTKDAVQL